MSSGLPSLAIVASSTTTRAQVGQRRQVVHDVEQHLLQDRPQAARARLARQRLARDGAQRLLAHLELDALHAEHLLVLLDERVLGLDEDLDERRLVEFVQRGRDRQPPDEFGNQPELDEILRLRAAQEQRDALAVVRTRDLGAEADAGLGRALADDLLQAVEGAAADEEDVRGVDLHELLVRDACGRPAAAP